MNKKLLISVMAATTIMSAHAGDTIKIALAGPETGPVTQYGLMQNVGARMAIEKINAAGGVNGKQLEAVTYDDACEPKQAVTVANKIVSDEIDFVIGHLCSSSSIPAAKVYDEEGIIMITPASTSPELTAKGFETTFRTIGLDTQTTPIAAAYLSKHYQDKKIAVLHDKQQYGQGLAEGVTNELKALGVEVAFEEGVNKGQTDFSALITKLKKEGIEVVYWGGYHPEFIKIVRQGADQGFKPVYMGSDGIAGSDVMPSIGDAAEQILITVPTDFTSQPENADLVQAFKDKQQDPTGAFVMPAYAAVQVIADSANQLKTEDAEKIAEMLHSGKVYNTPIGEISFQETGDLKAFPFAVYISTKDGKKLAE